MVVVEHLCMFEIYNIYAFSNIYLDGILHPTSVYDASLYRFPCPSTSDIFIENPVCRMDILHRSNGNIYEHNCR
jgi:hypothetical protein